MMGQNKMPPMPMLAVLLFSVLLTAGCKEVMTNNRPWLAEGEFRSNPLLHATSDQIIVFDLEAVQTPDHGRPESHSATSLRHGNPRLIRNTVNFLVRADDPDQFGFCIPAKEPYIAAVELENADGKIEWHSEPGDDCSPSTVPAGRYRLHVLHDPAKVPATGKKLFLHHPRTRLFRHAPTAAPGGVAGSLPSIPDFMAFKGPNGYFVSDYSSPDAQLTVDSDTVYPTEIWRLAQYPNTSAYTFTDGGGQLVSEKLLTDPAEFYGRDHQGQSGWAVPRFQFNDKGNWQFTLTAWWEVTPSITSWADMTVDGSNRFVGDDTVSAALFTAMYQGFACPSTCNSAVLPLQEGEIALFSKSNYQGDAVVARTDVNFFADYNASGSAQTHMESVRVGPNTFVILYTDGYFDGEQTGISIDTPSLSGTSVGSQGILSWNIFTNARQFILQSDTCVSCNLEGIDLSHQNLSAGVFTGSDFTNANLSGTNFNRAAFGQALLTGANLSDADFSQAILTDAKLDKADLNATDFSSANLTGATLSGAALVDTTFQSADLTRAAFVGTAPVERSTFSGANLACTTFGGSDANAPWDLTGAVFGSVPDITGDFSCRLSLKNTTLYMTTFAASVWRYLDLSGSTLENDTGSNPPVLSTLAEPLDLSGAILSATKGLGGAVLDGAHLGCAADPNGKAVCSQLIDADLAKASLKKTVLTDAALNGANLSFANLSEADLSGAQLLKSPSTQQSATLEGAMLKNANLSDADMSGTNLTNANWYSTSAAAGGCPGATWTGSCASGQGASLNSADLEGAYLSGLDLSDSTPQGANFAGAVLVGANFTGANLSRDPSTGVATKFTKSFLQGADFTDAITTGANFTSAYVDLSAGGILLFQLPIDNLEFVGLTPGAGKLPGCVEFSYASMTTIPATTSENICPDGNNGACSDTQWQSPVTPIDDASPPSTPDTAGGLANGCNISTMDINWILP